MNRKKIKISRVLVFLFLALLALGTIFPFIFLVMTTFKDKSQYMTNMFALPTSLDFSNYSTIFTNFDILRMNLNTFFVVICSVFLSLFVTSMAGFSISKLDFFGKKILFGLIGLCMIMPGQVLIIPIYNIIYKLGLLNTLTGLILYYVGSSIPFATFLIAANCKTIPNELIESAKIDGASMFKVYLNVIIPMLKPTMAAVFILNFLSYWNELLYAMIIIQKPELRTLTVSLMSLTSRYTSNEPLMYTGLLINCIPVVIVFFLFQKQLIKGVSAGAVK